MYRVALIGCGRIAPDHLDSLVNLSERAEVVAICDTNGSLRQERQQVYDIPQGFGSVGELLAWNAFDIAVMLTPPDIRSVVSLPLMDAGKHVMIEKPFTHSMEEAHTIVNAAESAGVTLAVSQNFRKITLQVFQICIASARLKHPTFLSTSNQIQPID